MEKQDLIIALNLEQHPEGGWFNEIISSDEYLPAEQLPERYTSDRKFYTSIYFLVDKNNPSRFHKIKSDEIWIFLKGDKLKLYLIGKEGKLSEITLGNDISEGDVMQFKVERDTWIAAETIGDYSLVACVVIPGFEYEDFELANRKELIKLYPEFSELIERLTND